MIRLLLDTGGLWPKNLKNVRQEEKFRLYSGTIRPPTHCHPNATGLIKEQYQVWRQCLVSQGGLTFRKKWIDKCSLG